MRTFDEIFRIAAKRKGGIATLEQLLRKPRSIAELIDVPDDRWLSTMARAIFQAGFNWQVVDAKWPGFEAAFDGFRPNRVAMYQDDDLDRLLTDVRIVRNGPKIRAVIANAAFLMRLAREHGSAARYFAQWPSDNCIGLLEVMEKQGSHLGGVTSQRVLRALGWDCFILSPDVVARLTAEGIVTKQPSSRRDLSAVQQAFNTWREQSGRSLTEISQTLAMSIGGLSPH